MRSISMMALFALAAACAKEPTAPAAKVEETAPKAAPAAAAPVAGEKLSFTQANGKVQFVGAKVTGSHTGTFNEFAGTFTLPEGAPEKGAVEVTIQTASAQTDSPKLDGHLKSADFFDVEKIPTATFKSTAIAKTADGYTVTGDLNLHGVTKQISFPAKIGVAADKVTVDAAFTINRKDFGIVYPGMPDDLIRDAVELTLALAVPRATAAAQ